MDCIKKLKHKQVHGILNSHGDRGAMVAHLVVVQVVAGSNPVDHPSTSSGFADPIKGMPWHIYILLCDQKTYYVGLTSNLQNRFSSHKRKENIGTKKFSKLELIYSEEFETRKQAEIRETQLKKWSVAKKKALISGNKELLIKLSKSRGLLKYD